MGARIYRVAVALLMATSGIATASAAVDYDRDDDGLMDVSVLEQLDAMRYDLDGDGAADDDAAAYAAAFPGAAAGMGCPAAGCVGYELTRSLDFAAASSYAAGAVESRWVQGGGWLPIGEPTRPFAAVFEGNGHTVAHLFVERPDSNAVGLFGGNVGALGGVGVVDVNLKGRDQVGALAGWNAGVIGGSHSTGAVAGGHGVGGLVGRNHDKGRVSGSHSSALVNASNTAGGLVGINSYGTISGSHASGVVVAARAAGGLTGFNERGLVEDSFSDGSVFTNNVLGGGVAGYVLFGRIANSRFTGFMNCFRACAGVTGINIGGVVEGSESSGEISATDLAGGVVAINQGSVIASHAAGSVSVLNGDSGGVVGVNYARVLRSHSAVDISGNHRIGGLVGVNRAGAEIDASYAAGAVSGGIATGGLVGLNRGTIDGGYATGSVSGRESDFGGLVGWNGGVVRGSYTKGDVRAVSGGGASNRIGGLVGSNSHNGLVSNSYAAGAVSGDFETGGLIGWNDGVVAASYAVGAVDGIKSAGAFIGNNTGYVIDGYWNTDTSSRPTGVARGLDEGVSGMTSAELRRPTDYDGIYAGWTWGGRRWDFGGSDRLPALKADIDGDGRATRDEFGPQ